MADAVTAEEMRDLRYASTLALPDLAYVQKYYSDKTMVAVPRDTLKRLLDEYEARGRRDREHVAGEDHVRDLERARALLRRFEWVAGAVAWQCPACGGVKDRDGHQIGCELAALIGAT